MTKHEQLVVQIVDVASTIPRSAVFVVTVHHVLHLMLTLNLNVQALHDTLKFIREQTPRPGAWPGGEDTTLEQADAFAHALTGLFVANDASHEEGLHALIALLAILYVSGVDFKFMKKRLLKGWDDMRLQNTDPKTLNGFS